MYIKRKFCYIIPRKKLSISSYVTELVMLEHKRKYQFSSHDIKKRHFFRYVTLITVQNDLHPNLRTILCVSTENLLPFCWSFFLMWSANSMIFCNRIVTKWVLKHWDAHSDVIVDNLQYVDIAWYSILHSKRHIK